MIKSADSGLGLTPVQHRQVLGNPKDSDTVAIMTGDWKEFGRCRWWSGESGHILISKKCSKFQIADPERLNGLC